MIMTPRSFFHASPHFLWNHAEGNGPLNLSATLTSGQSFRWRRDATAVWWGVIGEMGAALWQVDGQPDGPFWWQTFPQPDQWDPIADYLRLDVGLDALYAEWTAREPRIAPAVTAFRGLRILRQPPEECFFAFQCAACNTISKIERSVRQLAVRYGQLILPESEESGEGNYHPPTHPPAPCIRPSFFAFPTLDALAGAEESMLRADLWGYRAPRVIALARHLLTRPPDWLRSLRKAPYREAHAALTALHGVGAKLADCVCLFALDKDAAVPVDTHVRQIATRLFLPEMADRSLTLRRYTAIADAYRERFGPYAGWAQQYLFFGELRHAGEWAQCSKRE